LFRAQVRVRVAIRVMDSFGVMVRVAGLVIPPNLYLASENIIA